MAGSNYVSPQHEAARLWAERGFPVFPWALIDSQKRPLVKQWEQSATVDPAQIDAWWKKWPAAGVGSPPHRAGCFVIDVDDKDGRKGSEDLSTLERENSALPPTMENLTGSGGRHLWFKGESRNSVGKLAPGLDVRGKGGWAALPDGANYMELNGDAPAAAPEWLLEKLALISKEHEAREAPENYTADLDVNVEIATSHLRSLVKRGDVAIEGSGGNDRTYRLAQELQDLGLSSEKSLALMEEHWNPHCVPPWSRDELSVVVDNATAYRQNAEGVKGLDTDGSTFSSVPIAQRQEVVLSHEKLSRFRPLSEDEQNELKEPVWLLPGWLSHSSVAMLYGEPGAMKSFAALDIALSVAAGIEAWGLEYSPRSFPVIYIAAEGAVGIAKMRRPAWRKARSIEKEIPFYIVPEAPLVREMGTVVEFMREVEKRCLPRLIVLDTYSRSMAGLDENSAQDASKAIELADGLKKRYNCTVLIIHHCAKGSETERGSTVLRAGVDTVIRCVADEDKRGLTLYCSKQKDAEEPKPLRFRVRPVEQSIVIERTSDKPSFTSASSQLKSDIAHCLREANAVNMGSAMTTTALADSLSAFRGDEGDPERVRANVRSQLISFSKKKEGRGYCVPQSSPPLWFIPSESESSHN